MEARTCFFPLILVKQISTSSSRVVKILGDALCVRTLMRDTCGCDVSLSLSTPAAGCLAPAWGCSDSAAVAGISRALFYCACNPPHGFAGQWRALKAARQASAS